MNRVFLLPLVTVIAFFVLYFVLASTTSFLSVEKGYAIGEVSRWCERISGGFFREPFNALSNLGFITTGLIMFWIIAHEPKNQESRFVGPTPVAILYAATAVFLGPGHRARATGGSRGWVHLGVGTGPTFAIGGLPKIPSAAPLERCRRCGGRF